MAVNTKAFVGWWFYGASDSAKRAALTASWGLIEGGAEVVSGPRITFVAGPRVEGFRGTNPGRGFAAFGKARDFKARGV